MRRHMIAWSPDTPQTSRSADRAMPDSSKPPEPSTDKTSENAGMGYGSQGPAAPPGVTADQPTEQ
ncbi:hypothetical protein D3C72_504020 [compost metagenome]